MVRGTMKGRDVNIFSEAEIALRREVGEHPELLMKLAAVNPADWPEVVGCIAAHCDIAMDGWYTEAEFEKLYGILYDRLKSSRSIIVGI